MISIPTCRDGTEHLMSYVDGVLEETTRRAIDAHLAGCARCVAFVRSYASVPAIVRDATLVTLTSEGRDALRRALSSRRH